MIDDDVYDFSEWFTHAHKVTIHIDHVPPELVRIIYGDDMTNTEQHNDNKREMDADGNPMATLAGADPGNTDPDQLVAPLDPDDNVYDLVNDEQQNATADKK